MSFSGNEWHSFWKMQSPSFNQAMQISTTYFAKKLARVFDLKPGHQILDYGSGPGILANYFEGGSVSVTSADINDVYIEHCKNTSKAQFIHITTDTSTNRKILESQLGGKKFDYIILLSVIQYFNNRNEVSDVVQMLLSFLHANGKLVIADVITPKTNAFSDAKSLLLHCIRQNRIGTFVRFIFYVLFSDYRKHRKHMRLLTLSAEDITEIANKNLLSFHSIKDLTIHSRRTSYVFTRR